MIAMVVILGLAATSGGEGDNRLLLWNVSTGELASDLNTAYRSAIGNGPGQHKQMGAC